MGIGATHGTTPVLLTAFKAEATIACDRKPLWHLGAVSPDGLSRGKWGGGMKLTLEGTAVSLGWLGDILDATGFPPVFNINLVTTDTANTFTLNFSGMAVQAPNINTDLDGVVTVELDLKPTYNTTLLSCWQAILVVA